MSTTWIDVRDFSAGGWAEPARAAERARFYCGRLEAGDIVVFGHTPFEIPEADRAFLCGVRQAESAYLKNISYRPREDRVRGLAKGSGDTETLRGCMRRYSQAVARFATDFLRPYAAAWQLDFASFRSVEEDGRRLSLSARNDLLHVDSFPTRPVNGARILRVFTNVNPEQSRQWLTTETFDVLAPRFAGPAGLHEIARRQRAWPTALRRALVRMARRAGLPVLDRPPYDQFMLRFHHWLKANAEFQAGCPKFAWEFPPNATWLVFTDMVPHAVLSGRLALEQTLIVPLEAMVRPEQAPLRIAEALAGAALTR